MHVQKPVIEDAVGSGYFASLSEPMVAGRDFVDSDQRIQALQNSALPVVVVVNESAARSFFGNQNAIGKRLKDDEQSYEVVGVVRDLKNGFGPQQSAVYMPLTARNFARPPAGGMTVMVRSDSGSDTLKSIGDEITSVAPDLTIFHEQTLSQYLDDSRSDLRYALRTYGGIGVFGLVLAAIGLSGVTAYSVAQRRKEIGIRTAVGASKGRILRLVMREAASLAIVGTLLGFLGAFALVKYFPRWPAFLWKHSESALMIPGFWSARRRC